MTSLKAWIILYLSKGERRDEMNEIRKGNKAIQIISNMMFYGQYYKDEFQVIESKDYSERKLKNFRKKYNL